MVAFHVFSRQLKMQACAWSLFVCALLIGISLCAIRPASAQEDRFPNVLGSNNLGLNAEIYIDDEETGERVLRPDLTMQELLQFRRQQNRAGEAFQFKQVRVDVDVKDSFADVEGVFGVQLGPGVRNATIPLLFGSVQLGDNAKFIRSQDTVSQFVADESGYRWILLANDELPVDSLHEITLRGKSVVSKNSDRRQIRIALPTHPTTLNVSLPAGASDIRLRPDDLLVEESAEGEKFNITVSSLGGEFTLSYRPAALIDQAAGVEADSRTSLEITTPDEVWKANTKLTVRWYGSRSARDFRIVLPPGARWVSYPVSDYERYEIIQAPREFTEEETADSGASENLVDLIVKNRDPSQTQSIELGFEWEWMPNELKKEPNSIRTPVLKLEGVSSHRGTLDCVFPAAFSVVFREGSGVRLSQQGKVVGTFGQRLQRLRFGLSHQDYDLELSFRSQQRLPMIRPTYLVQVQEKKLVMTGWLECHFDLSPRIQLGLVMPGWTLRENDAQILTKDQDRFSEDGQVLRVLEEEGGSYTLTPSSLDLQSVESESGVDQVWRFVAERNWEGEAAADLSFAIPQIVRGLAGAKPVTDHGSGALLVQGTSNMVLNWSAEELDGLLADSSEEYASYFKDGPGSQPIAYRFQSRGQVPAWRGDVQLLPQAATVEELAEVNLSQRLASMTQRFQIQVANVPVKQPKIAVRADACSLEPQFFYDGLLTTARLVEQISLPGEDGLDVNEPLWNVYQLLSVGEVIGSHQIIVVSAMPWELTTGSDPSARQPQDLVLPLSRLLLPVSPRVLSRRAMVETSLRANRKTDDGLVAVDAAFALGNADQVLSLSVLPRSEMQESEKTTLGDTWLQTAMTGSIRQDRYVAQVRTDRTELRIRLPDRADVRPPPRFLINGARHTNVSYDPTDDIFIVPLELADTSRESALETGSGTTPDYTLEIFYTVRSSFSSWNNITVAVPRIEDARANGRFYWQLATPRTTHLTTSPPNLTPEWRWRWANLWWVRASSTDERGLIRKLGAVDYPLLPISANDYLLSGSSPETPFQVVVISRFLLWLPIGTLAILMSALVINVRQLRQPLVAFVIVGLLATIGMYQPDLGVLLGQTAVVSLGLVGLVFLTQAAIDMRVRRRSVFATRPSTYMEGSDHFSVGRSVRVEQAVQLGSSAFSEGDS